jgi:FkbM family methyltransferase
MTLRERMALRARFRLWAPWRIDRHNSYYLSHSMFGEDMVLRHLTDNARSGFYVDIGAHHPVFASNTYHFYRRGWRGINVDALPGSMDAFRILRPRDINLETCLSTEAGRAVHYFMFEHPGYNTIDPAKAEQVRGFGVRQTGVRIMQTTTLSRLLEQYLPADVSIDILTVDVEGLDEAILRNHDWDRYPARIVLFECFEPTLARIDALPLVRHLNGFGYETVARCGLSVVMTKTRAALSADQPVGDADVRQRMQ